MSSRSWLARTVAVRTVPRLPAGPGRLPGSRGQVRADRHRAGGQDGADAHHPRGGGESDARGAGAARAGLAAGGGPSTPRRRPARRVEFLDRLRAAAVTVRERRGPSGELTGYAVGRAEPGREPVLFGGGRLTADLSLPKLQARWGSGGERPEPLAGEDAREQLWHQATTAASEAAEAVRAHHTGDPAAAGDAAAAAAEVLAAAGRLIEGSAGGPLTEAARDYDRAARERYGRLPDATATRSLLRAAAFQLAHAGRRPGRSEAAHIALLITQVTRLALAVSRLREAQGRPAQAGAARHAALKMHTATGHWDRASDQLLAEQARQESGRTRVGPTAGDVAAAVSSRPGDTRGARTLTDPGREGSGGHLARRRTWVVEQFGPDHRSEWGGDAVAR